MELIKKSVIISLASLILLAGNHLFAGEAMPKPKSNNPEAQKLIEQALVMVKEEMSIKTFDHAIVILEKALKLDPDNPDIMIELANYYWQRGDQMPKETDKDFEARNVYFNKGKAYAEKALKLKECAGAYYWYSANLASSYQNRSVLAQAKIFPTLKKNTDWIEAHDPGYFYGGGARLWSKIVAEVPDALLKMGLADPEEVYQSLNNAIKFEPRYLLNYVYKANFCWRMGKKDEALKELEYALRADPNIFPEEVAKNRLAQQEARESWKKFTGKDWLQK